MMELSNGFAAPTIPSYLSPKSIHVSIAHYSDQPTSKDTSIPKHNAHLNRVDGTADTMQPRELCVQRLHLLALRAVLVVLLAILRLLVFPRFHGGCRQWTEDKPVCEAAEGHARHCVEGSLGGGVEEGFETVRYGGRCCACGFVGQGHDYGAGIC